MSMLKRLFGGLQAESPGSRTPPAIALPPASPASPAPGQPDPSPVEAGSVRDIVRVEETTDAEFFAGDLFRRRFGADPPDYPRHYVAFYRHGRTSYLPVGYIHYTTFEDSFLCGGMVIDERLYRRLPPPHRKLIRDAGGIAEIMLRETFARLAHAPAIWGYVGDKQAEAVDARVGFRHTRDQHVMVVWNRDLSEEEREARLARVIALGPF